MSHSGMSGLSDLQVTDYRKVGETVVYLLLHSPSPLTDEQGRKYNGVEVSLRNGGIVVQPVLNDIRKVEGLLLPHRMPIGEPKQRTLEGITGVVILDFIASMPYLTQNDISHFLGL